MNGATFVCMLERRPRQCCYLMRFVVTRERKLVTVKLESWGQKDMLILL